MLNMKKGLALVLAAATALTFAPVANLGAQVEAQAGDLLNTDLKEANISVGAYRSFQIKDIKGLKNYSTDAKYVVATVSDPEIVNIAASSTEPAMDSGEFKDGTDSFAAYETNANSVNAKDKWAKTITSELDGCLAKDNFLAIAGVKPGTTKITISAQKTITGEVIASQTINVTVDDSVTYFTFDKTELTASKVKDSTYNNTQSQPKDVITITAINNLDITDNSTAYDWKVSASSSDDKVVKAQVTAVDDTSDATATDAKTAIEGKAEVTATYTGVGDATITIKLTRIASNGAKKVIATDTIPVKVTDSTDTLTVRFDSNRDGKLNEYSLATFIDATTSDVPTSTDGSVTSTLDSNKKITTLTKQLTNGIVLDPNTNKTAQIYASDSLKKNITFKSSGDGFSVDNNGRVEILDDATRTQNKTSRSITVSVGVTDDGTHKIAGLKIVIPVTINYKDTVSLKVSDDNGVEIAKTVGAQNVTLTGTSTFDDLPVLYMSMKDRTSVKLSIDASSGLSYVSGKVNAVKSDDTVQNDILSDVISYDNATNTITAHKYGRAVVTVTARNNGSTYDNATIIFGVQVVTKNANNKITATSPVSLTASNRTASINAKSTYDTALTYDIVKEAGSSETVVSSDVSVNANTGALSYNTNNDGSVVVRIQGKETTEALAPAPAYVTVNYSSTKAPSTLSVSTNELNLKPGDSDRIVYSATGSAVAFKSSNEDVATVAQDGTVTAKKAGVAFVTVTAPGDATHADGSAIVTVLVSENGEPETVTPVAVTGLKVKNKKGAKVSVTWDAQDSSILYRVYKKVGNGSWKAKNVTDPKATLEVKKGATVTVKVKAFRRDENGKAVWQAGNAAKAKAFKTDKK